MMPGQNCRAANFLSQHALEKDASVWLNNFLSVFVRCQIPSSSHFTLQFAAIAASAWSAATHYTKRRKSPQNDLLTRLLEAEVDGDRLTHEEILANWERARQSQPMHGIDPLA